MNLSVVIVAFKSGHLLEKLIASIPRNYEIIIIENSLDIEIKDKFEKHENVQVIIPRENLGYGKSFNLGLQKSKNNLTCFLSPDVTIPESCFENINNIVENIKDFAVLAPTYIDETIHRNYQIKNKKILKDLKVNEFKLKEVDEIDFAMALVNKSHITNAKLMDENFFLYFESTDACINLRKNNKKIYVVENLKFHHHGTESSDPKYSVDINISRNWHFCWSKFYLLKKHYGYLHGIRKTIPNLVRSFKMCFVSLVKIDKENFRIHKASLSGLINSYFLKKSAYRPLKNKEKN
tara:strand:- start:1775 stop:2653 length:879 start_codon:yes stop_codon:yes gene_type:complete